MKKSLYTSPTSYNLGDHVTATTQGRRQGFSEKEMVTLVLYHPLVGLYQKKIQNLSKILYGDKNALQVKMDEILKNPSVGDSLSWQISAYPASVHRLAGINVFGFKTSKRKRAEDSLITLCTAIECYTEAVKYAKESLLQFPDTELRRCAETLGDDEELIRYAQAIGNDEVIKALRSPQRFQEEKAFLKAEEEKVLLRVEINNIVRESPSVKRYQRQIQYWSKVVYGNPDILQKRVEELLHNSTTGEEFAWQLAMNPQSFGNFAGISMCGFKNSARRHAETGLSHLINAVENCENAIKQTQEDILQIYKEKLICRQSSVQGAKDLHKQQGLSQPSKLPGHPSETIHRAVAGTFNLTHTNEKVQGQHSSKITGSKTLVLN
ncbi:BID domain-containing T4SS effector [Bartonella sp. CB169]|uniref:BID domain-containing T4SS effector n=1 Tax=Bartonella sp. CB169 TaxID=3112257 RepID=UPI00300E13B9